MAQDFVSIERRAAFCTYDKLEFIFQEVARVIQAWGIFAFTTKAPPRESYAITEEIADGVTVFTYSREYIEQAELFCAFVVRESRSVAR
jgi:hypothetical protein